MYLIYRNISNLWIFYRHFWRRYLHIKFQLLSTEIWNKSCNIAGV